VGGYESWWDVPIAEVAELPSVQSASAAYREARQRERHHL
jgi:3D-(3,5/4)-trihydroxycyclohexane-1,2-dione acylhydrolase (decyclizing)